MSSNIDATKPEQGFASTQDVRSNFAAAKAEIEDLQVQVLALQNLIEAIQNQLRVTGS